MAYFLEFSAFAAEAWDQSLVREPSQMPPMPHSATTKKEKERYQVAIKRQHSWQQGTRTAGRTHPSEGVLSDP